VHCVFMHGIVGMLY